MASTPPPPPPPSGGTPTRTTSTRRTTSSTRSTSLADGRSQLSQLLIGEWGLAKTALDWAYNQLKAGHSVAGILAGLTERNEFKRRFPGIAARKKAGLGSISPDEYIQNERAYKQIFRNAGLPKGYFDSPTDFTKYIAADVSPSELKARVQDVYETVKFSMPEIRNTLAQYYGVAPSDGALLAYALNPAKGLDIIGRQVAAAQIGGAASQVGLSEDRARAEQLVGLGVSGQEARQGFGEIAAELGTEAKQVGATTGPLSQRDLEREVFQGDARFSARRKRRAQEAAAVFGGAGGVAANQQGLVGLGASTQQ